MRKVPESSQQADGKQLKEDNNLQRDEDKAQINKKLPEETPSPTRRSSRQKNPPTKLKDFVQNTEERIFEKKEGM